LYPNYEPRSYAINLDVTWSGPSVWGANLSPPYNGYEEFPWPGWVHKTLDVESPADTILLADMWESMYYGAVPLPGLYNVYKGSGIFFYCWHDYDNEFRGVTFGHRDENAANFLFCDGHVNTLSQNDPNIEPTTSTDAEDGAYYWRRVK